MALFFGKKPASRLWIGRRAVAALYMGAQLVWQSVRSCFGSGRWIGNKPWLSHEKWKTR